MGFQLRKWGNQPWFGDRTRIMRYVFFSVVPIQPDSGNNNGIVLYRLKISSDYKRYSLILTNNAMGSDCWFGFEICGYDAIQNQQNDLDLFLDLRLPVHGKVVG